MQYLKMILESQNVNQIGYFVVKCISKLFIFKLIFILSTLFHCNLTNIKWEMNLIKIFQFQYHFKVAIILYQKNRDN